MYMDLFYIWLICVFNGNKLYTPFSDKLHTFCTLIDVCDIYQMIHLFFLLRLSDKLSKY